MIKALIAIAAGAVVLLLGYMIGIAIVSQSDWGQGDEDEETDYDTNA